MNISEQLLEVQSELKVPKGQRNTFGNYNYRSCEDVLEAAKPLLKKNGLTLVLDDKMEQIGTRTYVQATATLTNTESQTIFNHGYARESETKKGMDDSQITGAASSYARKYALNGLFLIDDTKDADTNEYQEQASKPDKPQPDKPKPPKVEPLPGMVSPEQALFIRKALAAKFGESNAQKSLTKITGYVKSTVVPSAKFDEVMKIIETYIP